MELLRASAERQGSITGLVLPVELVVLVKLVRWGGAAAQTADVSVDDLVHCNQKMIKKRG